MLILPKSNTPPRPAAEPPWWQGKPVRFLAGGFSVAAAFGAAFLPMIPVWLSLLGVASGLLMVTVPFVAEGWKAFWAVEYHIWPTQRRSIAIGLIASTAIFVGASVGVSTYLASRPERPDYPTQLLAFYKEAEPLLTMSKEEVEQMGIENYQLQYYNWVFRTRYWINFYMSDAAAERFMQQDRGGLSVGVANALNPEHSRITLRVLDFRANLLVLMEDPKWQ